MGIEQSSGSYSSEDPLPIWFLPSSKWRALEFDCRQFDAESCLWLQVHLHARRQRRARDAKNVTRSYPHKIRGYALGKVFFKNPWAKCSRARLLAPFPFSYYRILLLGGRRRLYWYLCCYVEKEWLFLLACNLSGQAGGTAAFRLLASGISSSDETGSGSAAVSLFGSAR